MEQPLFILAPPRSFTSITCGMIGQHPQMYGLPEVNLFAADDYRGLSRLYNHFRPRLGHGLLRAMSELGLGGQTEENVETVSDWLQQSPSTTARELFEDLMHWAAPKRLVDKSPIYVFSPENLERISAAFPQAVYLHLSRHPRSNCESVLRINSEIGDREAQASARGTLVSRGTQRFIHPEKLDPERIWLKPHLRVLEFLEGIPEDRQMFMRGEDILADPDRHLPKIAEWLGVRTDKDAIESMKHPERSPYACYGPANARIGNDPGFLEDAALRRYTPKPLSLDEPMEWNAGLRFSNDLKELASLFGY